MTSLNFTPAVIYPATLNLNVSKWYVIYRYVNPLTFRKEKFRVYEDLNRKHGADKIAYAQLLRDAVNQALREGYSPFGEEQKVQAVIAEQEHKASLQSIQRSSYTVIQAITYYLEQKTHQRKSVGTMRRYSGHLNLFKEWLNRQSMLLYKASDITAGVALTFLEEEDKKNGWGNTTYNNYLMTLQGFFNMISKPIHGIIDKNPIEGAEYRETIARKHAAYSDEQLTLILKTVRDAGDTYMEGLILTSYYACVRSKEEMMALRAGNILYDRDLIRLNGEDTKARRDDYIPLDPELKAFYLAQGFDKLPKDYLLFGAKGQPGAMPASHGYYALHFRAYRDRLGMEDRFTLYGFKHTRGIHLANAGVDPYAIMQLYRHRSLDQTMIYLRDLGCTINRKATENSRKI
ncbi:tyrosine-type recombinase/integrase [Chitinophaga sp.]|uniref:tyrosine-type recombinase/integrase n=1 Tax=Chitinophaga sp. TaxID=1869181 RepID=UPI0031D94580